MKPKVIRIDISEASAGFLKATSLDYPALFVAAETREQLAAIIPGLLKDLFAEAGEKVTIRETEPLSGALAFVAFPVGCELQASA